MPSLHDLITNPALMQAFIDKAEEQMLREEDYLNDDHPDYYIDAPKISNKIKKIRKKKTSRPTITEDDRRLDIDL